jgi:two-component system, cell cycle sensor histidine kinase and response regulator CckA
MNNLLARQGNEIHITVLLETGMKKSDTGRTNLVDGKYGITDLVDLGRLRRIFERFTEATGLTIGFLDHPGMNILLAAGWRDICTQFHRGCPDAEAVCLKSNRRLLDQLDEPGKIVIEPCGHGLVDCATPIIVKGKHIASLATGQLFLKEPDIERFKRQARLYGFDEQSYLKAIAEIPVVAEEKLKAVITLLGEIALVLSQLGYTNLVCREETEKLIEQITERKRMEEELEREQARLFLIFDQMPAEVSVLDPHTYEILFMNRCTRELYGQDKVGRPCYTVFHGCDAPCRSCNNGILLGKSDDEFIQREVFSEPVGRHYLTTNNMIRWPDGRRAKLEISIDITDKKQAEEALRKSEEQFRNLFDNAMEGIFRTTLEGQIVMINPAMAHMLGYASPRDAMNRIADIAAQLYAVPAERGKLISRLVREERITGTELLFNKADGGRIKAMLNLRLLRNDEGRPFQIEGSCEDITARWHAEEALKASEEKYRQIFENASEGIYQTTPEGRYLSMNPAFARMFGYASPQEMIASVASIGPQLYVNPQEREELVRMLRQQDKVEGYEAEVYRKDKSRFWITINIHTVRDASGEILYFEGTNEDITERRQAEEARKQSESRLARIIEFLPDATFAIDLEGKIITWNRAIEEMTGFSAETMLGKGNHEYAIPFYGERRPILVNLLFLSDDEIAKRYSFIKKDGDMLYAETDVPCVRGQNRTLWGKASLLRSEQGDVIGAIEAIRDVTDRKLLESQLLQARKLEAVGTLAGGVAHDFNNILMGIQGYASLMMLDLDTQHPHHGRLKQIEEQVQSATDLTKQLLGFARGGRYEMRPADMNEIISKTSTMFGRTKKELTIHGKYEKHLWTVEVDRGQIEQVLLNLYVNAWQAMPSGGELYLETGNVILDEGHATPHAVPPGSYIRVSVADTGIGMEEETKKRIFDPFFTTKEMGRGTGLGLAMVYGIMKGHKGFVDVCSEPGQGTTFTLYLPASAKQIPEERSATPEAIRGAETILLVDDEPAVLEVSKEILESLGYTVHGKGGGQEAIAFFREMKNNIDLVILDMIMPGLSGGETFDRIRELDPTVKVILSSGYSLDGQAQQIMGRGCRGFIQKPFSISRLSRKIREVLEG